MKPCECDIHLRNDAERIQNRPNEIARFKSRIENDKQMIIELEKQEKEEKKPKPCLGHGKDCPCTEMRTDKKFTHYPPGTYPPK